MRLTALVILAIFSLLAVAADRASPMKKMAVSSSYTLAPFGPVQVTRPQSEPSGVVLFLSGSKGISQTEKAIAEELGRRGMLVALVSTGELMKEPRRWANRCLNANYPLVDLSRDVQHRFGVKAYMKPVILGMNEGGTLAYASLSQWPNGSYLGIVSLGFAPAIPSSLPWCAAPGFNAKRTANGTAWQFGPNKRVKLPWIAMHAPAKTAAINALAAAVPHARVMPLPARTTQWPTPVADVVARLLPVPVQHAQTGNLRIPDMPLSLIPAQPSSANRDVMAIIYSGDGGWVGIDRDVAEELSKAGIPVVGVDSLSYFWTARTPAGAGKNLGQLIEAFSAHWRRPRVLLIGYSFGAGAMPAMIGQLSVVTRKKIAKVALLGFSSTADLQFHLGSWLDIGSDNSLPTIPAVTRLRGLPMLCIRGQEEDDSACGQIPPGIAQQYVVPGGHHFDRNAPLLAQIILGQRKPGAISK